MSIIQEGLKDLGQTYISMAKCVNCPNTLFTNKPWHGILPQKPIGIQLYVNFPCYFGQHSTLQSRYPILSQFANTPNMVLMCLLNGCTIMLSKLLNLTTQHNWAKYRVNTFKFSFFAQNKITSFVLVRFQKRTPMAIYTVYLYLFAVSFSHAPQNSDYTQSNELLMINNGKEYQSKWSRSTLGYNWRLPGRAEENHKKNLYQESPTSWPIFKLGTSWTQVGSVSAWADLFSFALLHNNYVAVWKQAWHMECVLKRTF